MGRLRLRQLLSRASWTPECGAEEALGQDRFTLTQAQFSRRMKAVKALYWLVPLATLGYCASSAHAGMAIYKFTDLGDKVTLDVTAPYPDQEITYDTTPDGVETATFTANVKGFG